MSASRFAIVLDNKVISAPVHPRADPRRLAAIITGSFTAQSANDLAVLLRAGALPAPLNVSRSARSAPTSAPIRSRPARSPASIGFVLIVVCMIVAYGLFGVFANVALLAQPDA